MAKKKKKTAKKKAAKRKAPKKKTRKKNPPPAKKSRYIVGKTPAVVETLIACGMNIEQVCEALLITRQTLWNWRNENPELETAIEEGRRKRADRTEDALFDYAEPHDEVTVKEKGTFVGIKDGEIMDKMDGTEEADEIVEGVERETTTKKGVISERLVLKILEAHKPEKYGKKMEHSGKVTVAQIVAESVKNGRK